MLKQSIAAAAIALAAAAPAHAAAAVPASFSGFASLTQLAKLPQAGEFKLAQRSGGASTPALPGLSSLSSMSSANSNSGSGGFAQTLKSLPETLVAAVPLTKNSSLLPSTALGLSSIKISKPSLKGNSLKLLSGGNPLSHLSSLKLSGNPVTQVTSTVASLPGTGLGLLTTSSSSLVGLPKTGVAILRSTLP